MSLRLRLIVGLAVLVVLGLGVFGASTYFSVEHFLVNRLDGQLTSAAQALTQTDAARGLTQAGSGNGYDQNQPGPGAPYGPGNGPNGGQTGPDELTVRNAAGPDLFVEFLSYGGSVAGLPITATVRPKGVAPTLPRWVIADIQPAANTGYYPSTGPPPSSPPASVPVQVLSAQPATGGASERVAVALQPQGGAIVVAASLAPVRQTLGRVLEVVLGVGGGVLLLTLLLGLLLARQVTRPLEEIAVTADAIAAGDLDRRVPAGASGIEAGRVAAALNAMLSRIQEAFARRDATEARLRTFVADASHELSTPLTSIRGYAELFHRGLQDRPEDLKKALERIENEATRMGLLVDDLLLLASFDAERPLHQDPVDLSRIAGDAASDLRAIDPERPVALEAAPAVVVIGDEQRLRQVAANLISNVRRHTPAGTPVTIRARPSGGYGLFEVADAGPGMSLQQAEHAFDRFYRVDKARSRAMGGAGLGLSIVASIAEAHGGHASVTTTPGAGATFSVAIPLALAAPAAPVAQTGSEATATGVSPLEAE